MNKCCDIEIQISEMVLGEVSDKTEAMIHAHIAECESCMGFFLSMSETFNDDLDDSEITGLSKDQKMSLFVEAKKADKKIAETSTDSLDETIKPDGFPWHIVLSIAAALVMAAFIVFPALSGASQSARLTHEKAMRKNASEEVEVKMDEDQEVRIEEPAPLKMRQRSSASPKMKAKKSQAKYLQLEKVSEDKPQPLLEKMGRSPVLTTVAIENVETNDTALEDVSDEAPSTDDNSVVEAVSDVVVSPSAFATPTLFGGRTAAGRASGTWRFTSPVEERKEKAVQVQELSHSYFKSEEGLDLLIDDDKDLKEEKKSKITSNSYDRRLTKSTAEQPQSTFSIDVDPAGYQIAKNQIQNNNYPDPNVLRAEEFINYQNYNYEAPKKETFNIEADMTASPFHKGSHILRVGIQGRRPGGDVRAQNNFMFIVDTSGSMADDGRLPLAKKVIPMIVEQMQPGDKVSLIAGGLSPRLVLDNVDAVNKERIKRAVENLNAVGATNLEANILEGYEQASLNLAPNTYNRVVLMSDGVANLGEVSAQNILKRLDDTKDKGIGITVVGMGTGEYNDNFLEQLANKGDGNYVFIEDGVEAQKTFEKNFAQTFHTIANNVKIQVDFDPQQVSQYRLLGYENRRLRNEDFRNDKVDAGEVGSGQSVTAIYELGLNPQQLVNPMAVINMRYKDVRDNQMKEQSLKVKNQVISDEFNKAPASLRLAFLAGKFAEVLKRGGIDEGITVDHLLKYMRPLAAELNNDPNVQEMLELMNKSK